MPGGRRVWSAYEILTAVDVNQYLSDQAVMRFADATARSAALPTPSTGMITALVSESGRPEYWNGSAWIPVEQGVSAPNILASGDPNNVLQFTSSTLSGGTWSLNTWYQITAGHSSPMVLYLTSSNVRDTYTQIGTGASGSEVVRAVHRSIDLNTKNHLLPYGVYVPASTRVAYRRITADTSVSSQQSFASYEVASGSSSQFNDISATLSGTSWIQVGTAPPVAGGVWVVGQQSTSAEPVQYGFGASGSEVAQTALISNLSTDLLYFPPFFWPPSTRLAIRSDASGSGVIRTLWRETLDV
jgi:hypothetical protein